VPSCRPERWGLAAASNDGRATVQAATAGDADQAAVALALHPLVPGTTVAGELLADYREQHGETLAYLS